MAPGLFLLAGICLQRAVGIGPFRRRWARIGASFPLGLAAVSLLIWAASFVVGMPVTSGAVGLILLGFLAAGLVRRPSETPPGPSWRLAGSWPFSTVTLLLFGAVTLALLADSAANPVHDFDGRMTWSTAAKYIAADRSVLPEAFVDRYAYVQHPQYPILMPVAQVVVTLLSGSPIEGFAIRPVYVLLLPSLLLTVWPFLCRVSSPGAAFLALGTVFLTPLLLWEVDVGVAGSYSDFPVAAFLGLGLLVAIDPRTADCWKRGVYCGIFIAATIGSKNEGSVLAAVLLASMWLDWLIRIRRNAGARKRIPTGYLAASAMAALQVALIHRWRAAIPNRNDERYLERIDLSDLLSRALDRGDEVLAAMGREVATVSGWGAVIVLLGVLWTATRRGRTRRVERFCFALLAVQATLAFVAYIHLPNVDKVASTLNRLVLQVSVPIVIVLSCRIQALILASSKRGPGLAARSAQS